MRRWIVLSMSFGSYLCACAADTGLPDELQAEAEDTPEIGLAPEALESADFFVFRNENSKRCLGVDRASTAAGARLKQFDCDCSANQQWRIDSPVVIKNHRALVNGKSNKCIGVDGSSANAGADLMQFGCDQKANQQWKYEEMGENNLGETTIRFRNGASSKCIGVDGANKANGAQLKQFACDSRANQRWVVHSPSFCSL